MLGKTELLEKALKLFISESKLVDVISASEFPSLRYLDPVAEECGAKIS